MPKIGSTATNSNAVLRTLSSQRPSLLTSVPRVYQFPARSATAPTGVPNGVANEAVSSVSEDRDANVADVAKGAQRYSLSVEEREVPERLPDHSPSLFPKQEWAGRVTAIDNGTFDAHLRDVTGGGREVATIDLEEVSPEDRARMRVGSLFHWVMGYERSAAGTRSNVSRIVFLDPPRLTKRDLERGRQWAEWLHDRWGSE